PIWSFDYVRPSRSVGLDGSGLEILNVHYRGHLIMRRAPTPIINAEYDSACSCFRDWSDSEVGFAATGLRPHPTRFHDAVTGIRPDAACFADATPGTVQTPCDPNMAGGQGGDAGTFRGVAIEDYGDELVLTTHMSAGWYRYRIKWHFYTDGRIWPEYSFAAATAFCTEQAHRHHAYWRFDFDLDGSAGEHVREVNPGAGTAVAFEEEAQRTWGDPGDGVYWEVADGATGFSFEVVPSSADHALPVDAFSRLDAMILRHHPGEIDDSGGSCAINPGAFVNGEPV